MPLFSILGAQRLALPTYLQDLNLYIKIPHSLYLSW